MASLSVHVDQREFNALKRSLAQLKGARVNAINRTASTKSIRPTTQDVKRRVRKISRTLARAIDNVVRTYKRTGTVVALVGINPKKLPAGKQYPTNILDLIEFGTAPHTIRGAVLTNFADEGEDTIDVFGSEVQHPGSDPQPVLRPAFTAQSGRMERTWSDEMANGVIKEFTKAKK